MYTHASFVGSKSHRMIHAMGDVIGCPSISSFPSNFNRPRKPVTMLCCRIAPGATRFVTIPVAEPANFGMFRSADTNGLVPDHLLSAGTEILHKIDG